MLWSPTAIDRPAALAYPCAMATATPLVGRQHELRLPIAPSDERFMQAADGRPRVQRNVVDAKGV